MNQTENHYSEANIQIIEKLLKLYGQMKPNEQINQEFLLVNHLNFNVSIYDAIRIQKRGLGLFLRTIMSVRVDAVDGYDHVDDGGGRGGSVRIGRANGGGGRRRRRR
ncbi:hypothetical protein BLOT_011884 [Blomia tropicalis]|nr:hypothetical protein BLOT_011884 [Blomia tropicalis]